MSAIVGDEVMQAALKDLGLDPQAARPGPAPGAVPACESLDSLNVYVGGNFVKILHQEVAAWLTPETAFAAARAAAAAGVGPEVVHADAAQGLLVMKAAPPGWRSARQSDLQDAGTLARVMAALREFQAAPDLPTRFDPFAGIDRLIAAHRAANITLPADLPWMRRLLADAEGLRDSASLKPCRNDGSSSNILIGPEGGVMLVDYDRAGQNDPLYDVGCLLAEVTDLERDQRAGFISWNGVWDEVAFARARLWSHVDDLLHGLWARYMAHTSARPQIEWLKYSEWRLLRARVMLRHPGFEEKLRLLRGDL